MTTNQSARTRRTTPTAVQENILAVATAEFAEKGFAGASINEIAEKTRTTKRMVYYHYGSKEGLYTAVLEHSYGEMRDLEMEVANVDDPVEALTQMCQWTFDRHDAHPDHARLVAGENVLQARYLLQSAQLPQLRAPALAHLAAILDRGRLAGVFREDVTAIDVHLLLTSLATFRVTNRFTFSALFDYPIAGSETRDHLRQMVVDVVLRFVSCAAEPGKACPRQG